MKYLFNEKHTNTLLQTWAGQTMQILAAWPWVANLFQGQRKLIFSSSFFWKPGSALQNSLKGLFRSLLHNVLKTCPELIRIYLPETWNEAKSSQWQGVTNIHFKNNHIQQAFLRLISDVNFSRDHCFCFWIDGLDEYEGTYQNDPKGLIDMFCSWTLAAPESIKLCVSSREHNVFMNALLASQRIRLHELTSLDMTRYTLAKLGHMSDLISQ